LKPPDEGCALCGSTWGDVWESVEGERRFFCCDLCARQYRAIVEVVKRRTGWDQVESVQIEGDRRERQVTATQSGTPYRFAIAFNAQGKIRSFRET
jgi:hypothetical protein